MLKLAGLLLLFSSAAMSGFYAAAVLEEEEHAIVRQLSFWRQFASQLECRRCPPAQIVAMLCSGNEFVNDRFFRHLCAAFGDTQSFGSALDRAICAESGRNARRLSELLTPLEDCVGLRDMESQLVCINSVILAIERQTELLREQSRRRSGLYRRLGILGGLLLAVVFY